jgi:hypothetical protein
MKWIELTYANVLIGCSNRQHLCLDTVYCSTLGCKVSVWTLVQFASALLFSGVMVSPVTSMRLIAIDTDRVRSAHLQRTAYRCFAVLSQLQQIRCLTPPATLQKLVVVSHLVLSWLDRNSKLINLPACLPFEYIDFVSVKASWKMSVYSASSAFRIIVWLWNVYTIFCLLEGDLILGWLN